MTTDSVSDAMTTDKELDALVEHLRRSHDCGRSNGFRCSRCESADAISALRKERDDYKTWWERDSTSLGKALAEARHHRVIAQDFRALAATLREERDRLREALEKVVSRIGVGESTYDALVDRHDRMQTTALEALGLAPQEPTT